MGRVPRPLRWLLPVVLVCGTVWSLWTPPFQSPDESVHYSWTESLVERGAKPNAKAPNAEASTETQHLYAWGNVFTQVFDGLALPPWSEYAEDRYAAIARDGPRDNGGLEQYASNNQPLYYAIQAVPYAAAGLADGTTVDRLYLMRWFSALWLLVTTIGAWLLAGEVFGRRRLPQLACAATLGMWPMITFLTGSVNPDGQLVALSTLTLWMAVRVARRGTTPRRAVALLALVVLATVTKIAGAVLFPAALFALITGLPQARARLRDSAPRMLGLGVGFAVLAAAILLVGDAVGVLPTQLQIITDEIPDPNGFASYLWQFYLPKPGFMAEQQYNFPVISELGVYNTWFGMSWGVYGWVGVWFPRWVYAIYFVIALVVLAGAAVTAGRSLLARRASRPAGGSAAAVITVLLAVAGTLLAVHITDYNAGQNGNPPFAQGRYLFPVAGVGGLAVGAAVVALPRRLQPAATAGWLGLLVVLQLAALSLVATRFYV